MGPLAVGFDADSYLVDVTGQAYARRIAAATPPLGMTEHERVLHRHRYPT